MPSLVQLDELKASGALSEEEYQAAVAIAQKEEAQKEEVAAPQFAPPTSSVEVRAELLESPFTTEDTVIREFYFASDASLTRQMEEWDFINDPMNQMLSCPLCVWPLGLLCVPLNCAFLDFNRWAFRENKIEELWARRLALTKDGISYKVLRRKPVGLDPTNPCAACCCAADRYKEIEIGASSKLIPYDRVQDVRTEQAAGGKRRIIQCGGCFPLEIGEMIKDVDQLCDVDTAGGDPGPALQIPGLQNALNFRQCVIALKHGRDLPPVEEGTRAGTLEASALHPAATHAMLEAPKPTTMGTAVTSSAQHLVAPTPQSMSAESRAQLAMLQSIDAKLGKLLQIAEKHGFSA